MSYRRARRFDARLTNALGLVHRVRLGLLPAVEAELVSSGDHGRRGRFLPPQALVVDHARVIGVRSHLTRQPRKA